MVELLLCHTRGEAGGNARAWKHNQRAQPSCLAIMFFGPVAPNGPGPGALRVEPAPRARGGNPVISRPAGLPSPDSSPARSAIDAFQHPLRAYFGSEKFCLLRFGLWGLLAARQSEIGT